MRLNSLKVAALVFGTVCAVPALAYPGNPMPGNNGGHIAAYPGNPMPGNNGGHIAAYPGNPMPGNSGGRIA
jgi:hypothetical protein